MAGVPAVVSVTRGELLTFCLADLLSCCCRVMGVAGVHAIVSVTSGGLLTWCLVALLLQVQGRGGCACDCWRHQAADLPLYCCS
jgi:hypothetical protein